MRRRSSTAWSSGVGPRIRTASEPVPDFELGRQFEFVAFLPVSVTFSPTKSFSFSGSTIRNQRAVYDDPCPRGPLAGPALRIRTASEPVPDFELDDALAIDVSQRRSILEHFAPTPSKEHDELSPVYGVV